LRLHDRLHHFVDNNGAPGPGGGRGGGVLLADGLSSQAEGDGAFAASARVPQPAVHDTRTDGRTEPRLPHIIKTKILDKFSILQKMTLIFSRNNDLRMQTKYSTITILYI
jgi:hypothetical protein